MALTVEEGMIRNIANRVISDGIGAFDVELGDFQAVGQIIDQVYKRIAYESLDESIIGTCHWNRPTNHGGRPAAMHSIIQQHNGYCNSGHFLGVGGVFLSFFRRLG